MAPSQFLNKRACAYDDVDCYEGGDWWWSSSGYGVRYAIIALIFVGLALILFGAYFHAQRRMRKGLAPLAYHRWLVARRQYRPAYHQNNYAYYQQDPAYPPQQGHPMHNMGGAYNGAPEFQPPPPAYGNWEPPPMYQPPQGASKVAANQNIQPIARNEAAGEGSSASLPLNNAQHNNHTQ